MTKQGNIVFLIEPDYIPTNDDLLDYTYKPISYIVADINDYFVLLLKLSPDGDKNLQRIIVEYDDIKNNCFYKILDCNANEEFNFLVDRLKTKNEKKIRKYIKIYEEETGIHLLQPTEF